MLKPTQDLDSYRPANEGVLSRSEATTLQKKNRAKINDKYDIRENKQHTYCACKTVLIKQTGPNNTTKNVLHKHREKIKELNTLDNKLEKKLQA